MKGQSLVEVLVAVGIGALLTIAAAGLIAPALRTNTQTLTVQTGATFGKELLENAKTWSQGDWHTVQALATSSANVYYFTTSTSPFAVVTGTESLAVGSTTYNRYFYLDDVYRDPATGYVTTTIAGNNYDLSTKRVTVVFGVATSTTSTLVTYVTRNQNNGFAQTDWSGGVGSGPVTVVGNQFTTSSNMVTNVAGALTLFMAGLCSQ
jgi:type II secretory pathway pseudopilin PulG